jgi:hypothetical protein
MKELILTSAEKDLSSGRFSSLESAIQSKVDTLFTTSWTQGTFGMGVGFDRRIVALIQAKNIPGYHYENPQIRATDIIFLAKHILSTGRKFLLWFVWLFSLNSYCNYVLNDIKAKLRSVNDQLYATTFQEQDSVPTNAAIEMI